MAVSSRAAVELVLLGPTHDRRQIQSSPILGDVWAKFATHPHKPHDLLISPYKTRAAGPVAARISDRLAAMADPRRTTEAQIAYLQGIVAAKLHFSEVIRVVLPMTRWWTRDRAGEALKSATSENVAIILEALFAWAAAPADRQDDHATVIGRFEALDRYIALVGLILCAGDTAGEPTDGIADTLTSGRAKDVEEKLRQLAHRLADDVPLPPEAGRQSDEPFVWQISLNRPAMQALERSVPAVKGDAAKELFKVKCDEIVWAVLDAGIDASHPALQDAEGNSRVLRSFDFSRIREIVSLNNRRPDRALSRVSELLGTRAAGREGELAANLQALANDATDDRSINWALVEEFVDSGAVPQASNHGTHVAGIIGAAARDKPEFKQFKDGMCPDIKLYDFRVLGKSLEETEFAVIAALQFIRYLNERHNFITVHGANLSLSIPHDVRNFACGRTPVCNECERLVASGVVVVAAAGNLGYHSFETSKGSFEGYSAFSITDPGNADGVITVGATHRFWPHTYGVSFFSSRGPTGDGRMKPDLVAPGERISSCLPGVKWGELDGTSMAAPHVSGAAAMLMARYSELIGHPARIKRILCESATDLGRERSFQGHGMLDVLRAFQRT